jgi:hypothetical protein
VKAQQITCDLKDVALGDRADIPDPGGSAIGRCEEARSVRAKDGGTDPIFWVFELSEFFERGDVPDPSCSVSGHKPSAV